MQAEQVVRWQSDWTFERFSVLDPQIFGMCVTQIGKALYCCGDLGARGHNDVDSNDGLCREPRNRRTANVLH